MTLRLDFASPVPEEVVLPALVHSRDGGGDPLSNAPSPLATCLLTFLSPAQYFGDTPLGTTSGPWDPHVSSIPAGAAAAHVLSVHPGCDLRFPAVLARGTACPVEEADMSATPGATQSPCSLSLGWEERSTGGSPSLQPGLS